MNKKILPFAIATGIILISTVPVFAETNTSGQSQNIQFQERTDLFKNSSTSAARTTDLKVKTATVPAQLLARLRLFKDQNKATIVQRLYDELNKVNKNRTNQMMHNLDIMTTVLDKVSLLKHESSSSAIIASGSASASPSATQAARTSIDKARAAVTEQMNKDYTIKISSESAARTDVKATRDQLRADLQATQNLVADARRAVIFAIRSLFGLK